VAALGHGRSYGIASRLLVRTLPGILEYFRLRPEWYGADPIHIRPSLWRSAWQEILRGSANSESDGATAAAMRTAAAAGSRGEAWRLYLLRPERQWLFGREQFTPQHGVALAPGGRVWLY
jgi:hypothetical protein